MQTMHLLLMVYGVWDDLGMQMEEKCRDLVDKGSIMWKNW